MFAPGQVLKRWDKNRGRAKQDVSLQPYCAPSEGNGTTLYEAFQSHPLPSAMNSFSATYSHAAVKELVSSWYVTTAQARTSPRPGEPKTGPSIIHGTAIMLVASPFHTNIPGARQEEVSSFGEFENESGALSSTVLLGAADCGRLRAMRHTDTAIIPPDSEFDGGA